MKKRVSNCRSREDSTTLPSISYFLLVAFIAAIAGVAFHSDQEALLLPSALISSFLLLGLTGKRALHTLKRHKNVRFATL